MAAHTTATLPSLDQPFQRWAFLLSQGWLGTVAAAMVLAMVGLGQLVAPLGGPAAPVAAKVPESRAKL